MVDKKDITMSSTIADTVYLAMRDDIMTAQLEPGDRLIHRQLAKQFGVSNIPIVEALRRLESDGLVISYPNAGAEVKTWAEDDIRGAFLAREALEGVACRLFIENTSQRERARLADYGRRFDEACLAEDVQAACEADIALHLYIAGGYNASAGTSALFGLVKSSCLLTITILNRTALKLPGQFEKHVGGHDELIAVLNSGDGDLAERTGKSHVRNALEAMVKRLS